MLWLPTDRTSPPMLARLPFVDQGACASLSALGWTSRGTPGVRSAGVIQTTTQLVAHPRAGCQHLIRVDERRPCRAGALACTVSHWV
jgi:hypothetical protein